MLYIIMLWNGCTKGKEQGMKTLGEEWNMHLDRLSNWSL